MIYSKKIKELRERKGITLEQLGSIINVEKPTYHHFETEYTIMPIKHLNTICNYFNTSIDYVFELNKEKTYIIYNSLEINKSLSGQRLKEFRKDNKLTQAKLSSLLNTTHSVIAGYESGRYYIATPFLYTICKKYNISADYLLGKTDSPKYLK